MYQYILFDLDGTLTDPGLGITNSVAYALERWGFRCRAEPALQIHRTAASGFFLSVFRSLGEESEQAVTFYQGILPQRRASLKIRCTRGSRNFWLSCRKVGGR